jgi:uncharacterized protein
MWIHPVFLRSLFAIAIALITLSRIDIAIAQAIPKALSEGGSDFAIKQRKNAWTVGVAGGIIDGTYMRFADELGKVLDDGDNLRILPMVSYGAASNLDDLLYLRGVDVAVTQSDVFEYFRTERKTINLQNRVHYLLRLPIAELHILAKRDIRSLEDLRGKKVNFGPAGSGSSLTGTIVFQRLGVEVEQVLIDQPTALQKLQAGEVAALVRVVGKPVEFFTKIPPNSGLHLVPIPFTKTFADFYTLGEFESKDYPSHRIERFAERLFTHWDKFLVPPRHPKWREVNLGGTVPGWTRHIIAEQMLERFYGPSRSTPQDIRRDFQVFLDRVGTGGPQSQADREALFRQFLKWREQQAGQTR